MAVPNYEKIYENTTNLNSPIEINEALYLAV